MSVRRLTHIILMVSLFLALPGCSPKSDTPETSSKGDAAPPKAELKGDQAEAPAPKPADAVPRPAEFSFHKSVKLIGPDGENRPPDLTAGGKNVGKMFEAIAGVEGQKGLWDEIQFFTPEGKKIRYSAHLKTDLGTIQIELFSDEAPNHVRNFIALARAGYYEGLCFHRSERKDFLKDEKDSKPTPFYYLEAGCPKGTGEFGYGSIGYWLLSEIKSTRQHEEGTIGAWHAEEMESAACRFYITLSPVPWFDRTYTIFGKIQHGLDIAHTINSRPVHDDGFRPREPVVLREVTIHSKILD